MQLTIKENKQILEERKQRLLLQPPPWESRIVTPSARIYRRICSRIRLRICPGCNLLSRRVNKFLRRGNSVFSSSLLPGSWEARGDDNRSPDESPIQPPPLPQIDNPSALGNMPTLAPLQDGTTAAIAARRYPKQSNRSPFLTTPEKNDATSLLDSYDMTPWIICHQLLQRWIRSVMLKNTSKAMRTQTAKTTTMIQKMGIMNFAVTTIMR